MIYFRGSGAGYCSRQIVTQQLHPELTRMPEAKRPFLDAGHYLQEHVEAFLSERLGAPRLLLEKRESEGTYVHMDAGGYERFTVTGHVDGIFDTGELLEVKAIKDASYRKLLKSYDWRDVYGHYRSQAQMYQEMFNSPGTHFVFYNRNTSEMCGPFNIDHEYWTKRDDMWEPHDMSIFFQIIDKFNRCVEYIDAGEIPDTCDAEGYCFFCGSQGKGFKEHKVRRVELFPEDPEYDQIDGFLDDINTAREHLQFYFNDFGADEIKLGDRTFRKEDYE